MKHPIVPGGRCTSVLLTDFGHGVYTTTNLSCTWEALQSVHPTEAPQPCRDSRPEVSTERIMGSRVYLCKDNDDLISHCTCREALVAPPGQADCPWCGCGWLFSCLSCRKAFTFARAVPIRKEREAIVREHLCRFVNTGDIVLPEAAVREQIQQMEELLADVEEGRQYVYLDGTYVPTDASTIEVDGWYRSHRLAYVPHVQAQTDPTILAHILSNPAYWRPGLHT